jgi:hypothetical protein
MVAAGDTPYLLWVQLEIHKKSSTVRSSNTNGGLTLWRHPVQLGQRGISSRFT